MNELGKLSLSTQDIGNVLGLTREQVQGVIKKVNEKRKTEGRKEIKLQLFKYAAIAPEDCAEIGTRALMDRKVFIEAWFKNNKRRALELFRDTMSVAERKTAANLFLKGTSVRLEVENVNIL